jgi:hypothetical protein
MAAIGINFHFRSAFDICAMNGMAQRHNAAIAQKQRLRALRWAASERSALATTEGRAASAALVVIVEQNRFELLAHVPFDVIGQHA